MREIWEVEYLYKKKNGLKFMKMWTKKKKTIETTPWNKLSRNLIDLTFNIESLVSWHMGWLPFSLEAKSW